MGDKQNSARPLVEKIWGSNFFDSLPAKWKSTLRMVRTKVPGMPNGTDPDEPTVIDVDNLQDEIVATSQTTTNRINEVEKTTESIQAELLLESTTHGQDLDEVTGVVVPFTEHLSLDGVEVGDLNKQINPLNPILSEVKTVDTDALEAVFNSYLISFAGTSNVDAPDFLNELTLVTESSVGDAASNEQILAASHGSSYSYTIPFRQTSQGSVAITKELIADYVPIGGFRRSTINYMFYMQGPEISHEDIAARLEALTGLDVVAWSAFSPKPVTVIIISKRISLQVNASFTRHRSNGDGGFSEIDTGGTGYSREVGITVKSIRIPPMIHANLGLAGVPPGSSAVDVEVDSSPVSVSATALTQSLSMEATATCRVIGRGLLATTGATSLPDEGLLIIDTNVAPYRYGWFRVQAETIDASTL